MTKISVGDLLVLGSKTRQGKNRLRHSNCFKITKVSFQQPEGFHSSGPFALARNKKNWFWFDVVNDQHMKIIKATRLSFV
jgi:hypothetical protein